MAVQAHFHLDVGLDILCLGLSLSLGLLLSLTLTLCSGKGLTQLVVLCSSTSGLFLATLGTK